MKKTFIALAAVAAAASASAQSSVNLYGIADVVFHKDKGASAALASGGVSTSRLGFKGSEDLGGGLRANFLLEQGLDLTSGAGGAFNRQSYVGLSGGFGEFKIGRVWTAYDDVAASASPVFDSVLSPYGFLPTRANYKANPNGGFHYTTPSFGGFSGAFSTTAKGNGPGNMATAVNLQYADGPVYVSFGYQKDSTGGVATKFARVDGTYDFGAVKVLASYAQQRSFSKDLTLGVDVPVSDNLTLSAGYARAKLNAGGGTATGYGFGAAYALSKRTTVYGGLRNDNLNAIALGGVDSRIGVGLKHVF